MRTSRELGRRPICRPKGPALMLRVLLGVVALAAVTRTAEAKDRYDLPKLELHGEMSNLLLWRNDSDFGATLPYYEEEGQSVGGVTTFLKPGLTFRPSPGVELFYEAELGMNMWSRNNPDQWFAGAEDYPVYKHREFWSGFHSGGLEIRTGYQRLRDPTDLFLSHWMGAALVRYRVGGHRVRLFVGQLPDTTFEGIDTRSNNFAHDNVTFGGDFSLAFLRRRLAVRAGSIGLYDNSIPRKTLTLANSFIGGVYRTDGFSAHLYGVLQTGATEGGGVDGAGENILAWAAAARLAFNTRFMNIVLGGFLLSPDDDHHGNDQQGAFFYSGKNWSRSLLLTEDEIRDRYDNYDERLSASVGSFFLNRAGLAVTDLYISGPAMGALTHEIVLATGFTLNPDNSMGHSYAGFEADLVLGLHLVDSAHLVAVGQVFFPGKASAIFINDERYTDLEAVEQIHGFQLGTVVHF